jgi:hypothetical protein
MGINTTKTFDKTDEKPLGPEAEASHPTKAKQAAPSDGSLASDTKKFIESQDKVEVYIPKLRGTQRVQINGVNFDIPSGVKVEVAVDVAALLKGSGALDLPPGV